METAVPNSGSLGGLSKSIAETIEAIQDSIVTVHGGGRSTSSGVVWRPGVIVTVRQGLRRSDSLQAAHHGDPFPATLLGADAGTDLAVLRVDSSVGKPAEAIPVPANARGRSGAGSRPFRFGRHIGQCGDHRPSRLRLAHLARWADGSAYPRGSEARRPIGQRAGERGPPRAGHQQHGTGTEIAVITVPAATIDRVVDAILERGHVPPFSWRCYASCSCPCLLQIAPACENRLNSFQDP